MKLVMIVMEVEQHDTNCYEVETTILSIYLNTFFLSFFLLAALKALHLFFHYFPGKQLDLIVKRISLWDALYFLMTTKVVHLKHMASMKMQKVILNSVH